MMLSSFFFSIEFIGVTLVSNSIQVSGVHFTMHYLYIITILPKIFIMHPNREKSHPVYIEYAPSRNFWLSRMLDHGCLQF